MTLNDWEKGVADGRSTDWVGLGSMASSTWEERIGGYGKERTIVSGL
jgi:hypothetical protein